MAIGIVEPIWGLSDKRFSRWEWVQNIGRGTAIPQGMAYSPDGLWLAVASQASILIYGVNQTTGALSGMTQFTTYPTYIHCEWTMDSQTLIVVCGSPRAIRSITRSGSTWTEGTAAFPVTGNAAAGNYGGTSNTQRKYMTPTAVATTTMLWGVSTANVGTAQTISFSYVPPLGTQNSVHYVAGGEYLVVATPANTPNLLYRITDEQGTNNIFQFVANIGATNGAIIRNSASWSAKGKTRLHVATNAAGTSRYYGLETGVPVDLSPPEFLTMPMLSRAEFDSDGKYLVGINGERKIYGIKNDEFTEYTLDASSGAITSSLYSSAIHPSGNFGMFGGLATTGTYWLERWQGVA